MTLQNTVYLFYLVINFRRWFECIYLTPILCHVCVCLYKVLEPPTAALERPTVDFGIWHRHFVLTLQYPSLHSVLSLKLSSVLFSGCLLHHWKMYFRPPSETDFWNQYRLFLLPFWLSYDAFASV